MSVSPAQKTWWLGTACLLLAWYSLSDAKASSYRVIYQFAGASDGANSVATLTKDGEGRLYGTTEAGGSDGLGIVFRLTKPVSGNGRWAEEILHSFSSLDEGYNPADPLILGPSGEVYGTTSGGGTAGGGGTIFRLDNLPGWPLTVLHSFGSSPDGGYTDTGLVFGANGLLYGDSPGQSLRDYGMAFSISPLGDAVEYDIIEKFGSSPGGYGPSQLVATAKGKLYGTSTIGGTLYGGTAFSLSLDSKGVWRETTLYNFGAPGDIVNPGNPLLIGHGVLEGSLFGCDEGGLHGQGAVFRLDRPQQADSLWTETILYNFGDQLGDPLDRDREHCGLTQDASGKLFGTTYVGGANGGGAFFELDPPVTGTTAWSEKVLHSFGGFATVPKGNGANSPPLRIGGVFYGTTYATDATGGGVVWEITP
jgi:uncharacterized repeat protein (TIGR03803 family)